ncbi:MAG: UDP-glucose--hexose-1-phosphate uridylyltransferase [Clostridiales bacterium]|nr:UDP-glucose--hexose-1-phosphate uridylyltransferase [Clostridiales bacterium]
MTLNGYIAQLVAYAVKYLGLSPRDAVYARNRILDILEQVSYTDEPFDNVPVLPDSILGGIFACLEQDGREFDRATLGEKLMDAVMLRPGEHEAIFREKYQQGPAQATQWAYDYAIHSDYVKKSAIDKNIKWHADNGLEITINLSKPEKNNKDLQKQLDVQSTDYPKCAICRENEGYERRGFSRRNMRTLSLRLAGEDWFWQYSPYAYFNEHGIAIAVEHSPMKLDDRTVERLFDFVEQFPHYFIGNNAPLPRVGGSILMHDHYQGGKETLPMQKAGIRISLTSSKYRDINVGVVNWPGTALRLQGSNRKHISKLAYEIATAWKTYENADIDILPFTGDVAHNTASCIARKTNDGYILDMILRNNRTSERYPDGIFHAHREYHHIKSESIGLIEAMGLFILPARLKRQLALVKQLMMGQDVEMTDDMQIFAPMIAKLVTKPVSAQQAERIMKGEIEHICHDILVNTAVFKRDAAGDKALTEFLQLNGLTITKR